MYPFKKHIAWFLLLLFVRVLTPEVAILELHDHAHTEDIHKDVHNGLKLDTKHTHCHTDNLYNTGFAPPQFFSISLPIPTFTDTYSVANAFSWKFTFPNNTDLRGPPVV